MSNLYKYISDYGDKTFEEVDFNEIDSAIFSQSIYLDFRDILVNDAVKMKISAVGEEYFKTKHKLVSKKRENLFKTIMNTKRYKNLILSNYIYKLTSEEQFSAVCIDISDKIRCVSFEGTDATLIGWKEDFELSYKDMIPAQKDAIKYLNKVGKCSKELIITGHSKGGNLALVSSIYTSIFIKARIKKIYSFDGPGTTHKNINSFKYKSIKKKYVKYIPKYSIVGRLFNEDTDEIVVDCKTKGIMCHSIFTWVVDKNRFKRAEISKLSDDFNVNFKKWINKYSPAERRDFCEYLFARLEKLNIYTEKDLKTLTKEEYQEIIDSKNDKFGEMLKEFLVLFRDYFVENTKSKIKNLFNSNIVKI